MGGHYGKPNVHSWARPLNKMHNTTYTKENKFFFHPFGPDAMFTTINISGDTTVPITSVLIPWSRVLLEKLTSL
jgi:hypothetical protein